MKNDKRNIEESIVPIKMADLVGFISRRRRIPLTDAICYLYDSPMASKLYDETAKWWYLDNETLYAQIERERKRQNDNLSDRELQFVVYCAEMYARHNSLSSLQAYALFKAKGLIPFLKDNFEVLHTQGEDYILNEIKLYLKRRKKA